MHSLFWTWHRRIPEDLEGVQLVRLRLPPDLVDTRLAAAFRHESQITKPAGGSEPILVTNDLEPLLWPSEYFILGQSGHAA